MSPVIEGREEYLTIIAPSAGAVMAQFKALGLSAQGYAIVGRIGEHRISLVDGAGSIELLSGGGMVAATFARRVPS